MDNRVRNSANPFVRDMPKYLRTSQMSIHGYPADKSILFQLETRLTEVTRRESWDVPCRHISIPCLSSWRAVRCSWSRSLLLFHPSVRTSLLGDNTRCFQRPVAVSVPWTKFLPSSNRLLGSMLVIFLRGGLWPVGACAFHIQPAKRTFRSSIKTCSFPTTFVLPVAEIVHPHVRQDDLARTVYRAAPGPAHYYLQRCQQYLMLVTNSQSDCLPSDSQVATIVSAQRPTSSKGTCTVV